MSDDKLKRLFEDILAALPRNFEEVYQIRLAYATDQDTAKTLLQDRLRTDQKVDGTEALTELFNTVLDSVRTYLGIKQKKMNIAEQTSSREQLICLVSLQEILRELEVLIIAFYLTEIARIVFEALYKESAGLMTVAFIPAALLASIATIRVLHRR
ncbi:MAG: hypothetical protein ACUVQ8_08515 [Nitrososphaeria archaeon]